MAEPGLIQPNTLIPDTGSILGAWPEPAAPRPFQPPAPIQAAAPMGSPGAVDLGRILMGFVAGTQGRVNPIMAFEEEQRARQLQQQIQLAQLAQQERARVVQEKQFDLNQKIEERRVKTDEEKIALDKTKAQREIIAAGLKSPDAATRLYAVQQGQKAGMFPIDQDPGVIASKMDPNYEKLHDQAIDLIAAGQDPTNAAMFGRQFDPTMLPVDAWKQALAKGGIAALNALKFKPDQTEGVFKARYQYLASLPDKELSEENRREKDAIGKVLKIGETSGRSEIERLALHYEDEDKTAGKPPISKSGYIERAAAQLRDRDSVIAAINGEADRRGLTGADRYRFFVGEKTRLDAARAAAVAQATPLPAWAGERRAILSVGLQVMDQLATDFTEEELRKYAGWFNYKGRTAAQLIAQDPKFAAFRSLVAQGKSIAFSDGGKNLTQFEGGVVFGWVPTGDEISPTDFIVKLRLARERGARLDQAIVNAAVTPKSIAAAEAALPPKPAAGTKTFKFTPLKPGPDGKIRVRVED